MASPKLRVRSSGHGGSGYILPAREGDESKPVKNSASETINARLVDGATVTVPGVTTVLKKLDKPGITQWAVDNTAAFAVANIDALLNRTEEQGWGFLRWYWTRDPIKGDVTDIRNFANGVLNDAADLGTGIHEWVAADCGEGLYPDTTLQENHFWQMVEQWDKFRSEHTIVPIHNEVTLWSYEYGYAGTADGIWEVDGVRTLMDLKSGRNTWDEHLMQLASLGACDAMFIEEDGVWVEYPVPDFSQYAILHIRPEDVDKDGNTIDPFCILKVLDQEEIPLHFEAFLGLLQVSQTQRKIDEYRKSNSKKVGFE